MATPAATLAPLGLLTFVGAQEVGLVCLDHALQLAGLGVLWQLQEAATPAECRAGGQRAVGRLMDAEALAQNLSLGLPG